MTNSCIKFCASVYTSMTELMTTSLSELQEMIKFESNIEESCKARYECLYQVERIKPYFDLDLKDEEYDTIRATFTTQKLMADSILKNAKNFIIKILKIPDDKKLYVSQSKYKKKISFHIVADYNMVKSNFYELINDHKPEMQKYYLDTKVYMSTQKFRFIHVAHKWQDKDTSKWYNKFELIPEVPIMNTIDFSKHIISYIDDNMEKIKYISPIIKEVKEKSKKEKTKKEKTFTPIINNDQGNFINSDDEEPKPIDYSGKDEVEILVSFLSTKRAHDYEGWLYVGFCLFNLGDYLPLWIKFSQTSIKFVEGECERKWTKEFRKNSYTIGTLKHWAAKDDFASYIKYQSSKVNFIDSSDKNVATILSSFLSHNMVHCNNKWFYFDSKWTMYDHEELLYNKINFIIPIVSKELEKTQNEKEQDEIKSFIRKINSTTGNKNIFAQLRSILYDKEFENKLDSNIYLFGFNDCTYDLMAGTTRPTLPEDYITMTCGSNYSELNKVTSEDETNLKKLFNEIFGDQDVRSYMFNFYTSTLSGFSPQQFYIFYGGGGNGKGLLKTIHLKALGDYGCEYQATHLSSKSADPEKASPALCQLKCKRYCVAGELKEVFNSEKVKLYTGGNLIVGRKNYSNSDHFMPHYKLCLECNDQPAFDTVGNSIERRLISIEFKSRYVFDKTLVNPQKGIYLANPDLYKDNIVKNNSIIWLKMLLDNFKILLKEGKHDTIEVPKVIKDNTNNYYHESDPFIKFLKENLIKTETNKDSISMQELFKNYTNSMDASISGKKMTKKDCTTSLLMSPYAPYYYCSNNSQNPSEYHPIRKNPNILGYHKFIKDNDDLFLSLV